MYRILVIGNGNSKSYQQELKGMREVQKHFDQKAEFKITVKPDEAVPLLVHYHPHILIARTKFLFQHGIDMLLAHNPRLKIILSSADCSLDHVVSFFNQGIAYYIHEPGLTYDYISGIQKSIDLIEKEEEQIRLTQQEERSFYQLLEEKALNQLVTGALEPDQCRETLVKHLRSADSMGAFCVAVFDLSQNEELNAEELNAAIQATMFHFQQHIMQNGFMFLNSKSQIILLVAKENLFSPPKRQVSREVTEQRMQQISRSYRCRIKAGAGSLVQSIEQIPLSYQQALQSLHLASGFNKTTLVDFVQHGGSVPELNLPTPLLKTLKSQIQQRAQWLETVDRLCAQLDSQLTLTSDQVKFIAVKILDCLEWRSSDSLLKQAIGLRRVDDLHKMLCDLALPQEGASNTDSLVERAKLYISQNYANPNLSLNGVAQVVHLSPPYLSRIFKQKMNLSFTDYLIQLRMEEAKALCGQSGLKTAQIAAKVGYQDASYFTLCFKKYVGMTPGGYKKTLQPLSAPSAEDAEEE